jgi:hypothetical protein
MSSVKTDEGEFRGSSNSAALVAGALALVKSRAPQKDYEAILEESSLTGWHERTRGPSLFWLGFSSPNNRCFSPFKQNSDDEGRGWPQHIFEAINMGAIFVQTTAGGRLMTSFDPIKLNPSLQRYQPNDLVLTTPDGLQTAPRNSPYLPNSWVEVFQRPQEMGLCEGPMQPYGKIFRLTSPRSN